MTAILGFLLSNPTILALIAAVLSALGWGRYREHVGRQKERARADRQRLESMQARKDKNDEIDGLSDVDLDERFNRWMRGDDG